MVETLLNESLSLSQASLRPGDIEASTILQWKRLYERSLLEGIEECIHEYIYSYNHEKPSTKLKGLSPVQYRNQSLALKLTV